MIAVSLETENPSVIRNCRFESGWPGFDSLCRYSMIKTLWNIYIKQKTRNLMRIPVFAMIGGKMKNCVNCGAPIETDKKVCPYCKTPYDVSGFKAEIGEMFGEITIGGKTSRVYLGNVERKQLLNSEPYYDANGILHREIPREIRKFTLIEV